MADYPVRDGAGSAIIENEKDTSLVAETYDYCPDYPVLDGNGGSIVATAYEGSTCPGGVVTALMAVNGDSRTQQAVATSRGFGSESPTDLLENARDTRAAGWVSHALAKIGHRVEIPKGAQFAIGAEGTTQIAARSERDAAQAAELGASVCVFLGGVNDTTLTSAETITNYITIFDAWTAQGIRLVVCNEMPRDSFSGSALTAHQERRAWLEDPQRATDYPGYVSVDTWGAVADPADGTKFLPANTFDGLHPNYAGSKAMGAVIGAALESVYPTADFPSLINLPTTETASGFLNPNPLLTGTGGTLVASPTPAPTGVVADDWRLAAASGTQTGVNIVGSKGTDGDGYAEQIITVSGASSLTTARGCTLTALISSGADTFAPGDRIKMSSKLTLDAGNKGVLGVNMGGFVQGVDIDTPSSGFGLRRWGAWSSLSAQGTQNYELDGTGIDVAVLSQELIIPENWDNATGKQIWVEIAVGLQGDSYPIDGVIRVGRVGVELVPITGLP